MTLIKFSLISCPACTQQKMCGRNGSLYMDKKTRPRATKIFMRQYIQQYVFTHAVLVRPIYW